ncbi:MAG: hypothetical protein H7338_13180, partial [Candidatus Sericytochromatia bacterium]|nr:hypothetical protein [Candidatus Sericytochromatia bacterium]
MTQTDPRLSWLSSVGMHVVLLLLMLLWGRLQPPLSLPKPAPIHLTLIDQPALTMRQGAPGPATGPQQVKSAVRAPGAPTPRQVVTPAQPKQTERRADAQTTRTVAPKVTKQAATVRPAAQAVPRPQGDFRAALAKRSADQAAQEQGRLAQLGGSGPGVIQGTGGGDAGSPGGELSGRHLVHEVRPTYPQAALSDKVSGRVVVAIVVAPDG